MKRNFNSSDSFTHFLSPSLEEEMNPKEDCSIYNGEFQVMLNGGGGGGVDGEDYSLEETGQLIGDKKRRLSNHQVKSLEKIFEVDNKLDPDRKVKVAQDLGLQPRQVAIWFQNRRARWKTKQLERDYNHLKANYDALKLNYHKQEQENETLTKELLELKAKVQEETRERNESDNKEKALLLDQSDPTSANHEVYTSLNYENTRKLVDLKDGFSDSDSSGVLNEENITTSNLNRSQMLNMPSYDHLSSSSTMPLNYMPFLDSRAVFARAYQQQQPGKMDDQFLVSSSEESCNIFSVDQAPNLCWYFPDHRNL